MAEKQKGQRSAKPAAGVLCRAPKGRPGTKPAQKKGDRELRLERIRKEIENGTYETEGKLRIAVSRLIDDILARSRKARRR